MSWKCCAGNFDGWQVGEDREGVFAIRERMQNSEEYTGLQIGLPASKQVTHHPCQVLEGPGAIGLQRPDRKSGLRGVVDDDLDTPVLLAPRCGVVARNRLAHAKTRCRDSLR